MCTRETREETEARMLLMIPMFITKNFTPEATHQFNKYIVEEEFDELELITDDFNDDDWQENCQIATFISEALQWNNKQKYRFWQYMRDFLGIQSLPPSTINTSTKTGHTSATSNVNTAMFAMNIKNVSKTNANPCPKPMNVDWNLGTNETRLLSQAKQELNRQCFNQLQANDIQSLVNINAIGIKNNIPSLIVLLYDIYTRYRIHQRLSVLSKDRGYIGPTIYPMQFVKRSEFLQNHMKHMNYAYEDIIECLSNFEARFLPPFYVGRNKVIDDDCNHFIEYSLMVGQILNETLYGASSSSTAPMEVNLMIIPQNIKSGIVDFDGESGESSDENADLFGDDTKNNADGKPNVRAKVSAQTIGKLLKSRNISYISSNISVDNLSDFQLSKKRLKRMFLKYLSKIGSHHQRVNIAIDRRQSNNEVYIYQLPEYNCIPDGYGIENLIFSCAHYVLPNVDYVESDGGGWSGNKYVGGKHEMFLLSFECMGEHLNRLHFFWTGGGMRFQPKLLAKIWPNCFSNMVVDGKYTEKYLVENFGLDCVDQNFEEWYAIFCGK